MTLALLAVLCLDCSCWNNSIETLTLTTAVRIRRCLTTASKSGTIQKYDIHTLVPGMAVYQKAWIHYDAVRGEISTESIGGRGGNTRTYPYKTPGFWVGAPTRSALYLSCQPRDVGSGGRGWRFNSPTVTYWPVGTYGHYVTIASLRFLLARPLCLTARTALVDNKRTRTLLVTHDSFVLHSTVEDFLRCPWPSLGYTVLGEG